MAMTTTIRSSKLLYRLIPAFPRIPLHIHSGKCPGKHTSRDTHARFAPTAAATTLLGWVITSTFRWGWWFDRRRRHRRRRRRRQDQRRVRTTRVLDRRSCFGMSPLLLLLLLLLLLCVCKWRGRSCDLLRGEDVVERYAVVEPRRRLGGPITAASASGGGPGVLRREGVLALSRTTFTAHWLGDKAFKGGWEEEERLEGAYLLL